MFRMHRIHMKMGFAVMLMLGVIVGIVVVGLNASRTLIAHQKSVYRENLQPLLDLSRGDAVIAEIRAQLMLSLQHDPENRFSGLHDHSTSRHLDAITKLTNESRDIATRLMALPGQGKVHELKEAYSHARDQLFVDAIAPAVMDLTQAQFMEANRTLLFKVNPRVVDFRSAQEAWHGKFVLKRLSPRRLSSWSFASSRRRGGYGSREIASFRQWIERVSGRT